MIASGAAAIGAVIAAGTAAGVAHSESMAAGEQANAIDDWQKQQEERKKEADRKRKIAAEKERKAKEEAAEKERQAYEKQYQRLTRGLREGYAEAQKQGELGLEGLESGYREGLGAVREGRDLATDSLYEGQRRGLETLQDTQRSGTRAIERGMATGVRTLGQAGAQARGDTLRGYVGAERALGEVGSLGRRHGDQATQAIQATDVTGTRSRLGEMYDKGFDFEADPGYQFRLREGEKAINRAASAQGGRLSGATLKALQAHGQGLASEEYDKAYGRRAGLAQQADVSQQRLALDQASRQDAGALAAQQNQMGLAQQGYRAIGKLGQLRADTGQALGGQAMDIAGQQSDIQYGGGRELASYTGDIGRQMSDLQYGTGKQAGEWQTAAGTRLGEMGQMYGQDVAAQRKGLADQAMEMGAQSAEYAFKHGGQIGGSHSRIGHQVGESYIREQQMALPYEQMLYESSGTHLPTVGAGWRAFGSGIAMGGDMLGGMYGQGLGMAASGGMGGGGMPSGGGTPAPPGGGYSGGYRV